MNNTVRTLIVLVAVGAAAVVAYKFTAKKVA